MGKHEKKEVLVADRHAVSHKTLGVPRFEFHVDQPPDKPLDGGADLLPQPLAVGIAAPARLAVRILGAVVGSMKHRRQHKIDALVEMRDADAAPTAWQMKGRPVLR